MKAKHYTIDKEKYNQETVKMNNKLNGFQVSPQNNVEYPGVEVNSMLVVKPSFIIKDKIGFRRAICSSGATGTE